MRLIPISIAIMVALETPAFAHPGAGSVVSFNAGFSHPLTGLDHITAMMAVGMWAAAKGNRATWVWPSTFLAVMLIGGALGLAHIAVPLVEPGILASVVVLGLMAALAVNPPVWVGAAIIGLFALLHGHAHGAELPEAVSGAEFVAGFASATAALQAIGVGLALALQRSASVPLSRAGGALCVAVGAGLYAGVL
ncbi:HupE/UreJ family protein [Mesorhizobium sp. CA15]|uniref:HupE/UreJ family protein n=1 Tax=Mesorhizobium sp. CA15 TaxID=2876641 RepID=UPI001CD13BB7|nr:HupE/UreJ family protein [Mesorhizobium sp. CA15]MBZ9866386.1 HupE/UreJ family protein [Mesorhizobium sp. CA15]